MFDTSLFDLPSFDLPSFDIPAGGWDAPALDWSQFDFGGASNWSWPDFSNWNWENIGKGIAGGVGIANLGLQGFLGWRNMENQADYQRQLTDYWTDRSAREAAYNNEVIGYLQARKAWEAEMQAMFGETLGGFGEGMAEFQGRMGAFQEQIGGIIQEELNAARPILQQSQELLEPAVAALARGEVPPLLEPVLNQVRVRARAAAMQSLASAGIEQGTASAAIEGQIDQQAMLMLYQMASQMLGEGRNLAGTALSFFGNAAQGVGLGMQGASMAFDPIMREFALMMQGISSLLGGFPPLAASAGPPPGPSA